MGSEEKNQEDRGDNHREETPIGRPNSEGTEKEDKSAETDPDNRNNHQSFMPRTRWWFVHEDPVARFTGWVAAFTFVLVIVAVIQSWAFIESERAYLSLTAVQVQGLKLLPGRPLGFTLDIYNGGRSEAFINDSNATVSFDISLAEIPNYQFGRSAFKGPVPPATFKRATFVPKKDGQRLRIEKSMVDKIVAGEMKLWVFGWVEYSDGFTIWKDKRTGFCVFYSPQNDPSFGMFDDCGLPNYIYTR